MFLQDARIKWSECLENVLNDGNAVNIFTSWMKNDPQNSIHPIYLHFAIVAYKDMVTKGDIRSVELARQIYRRYLRPDEGLCQFIPKQQREQIGSIIRNLVFPTDINLFDNCYRYVDWYLRQQHANFVVSDEFINYFNQLAIKNVDSDSFTLTRYSNPTSTLSRKNKRNISSNNSNSSHLSFQTTNNSAIFSQYPSTSVLSNAAAELLLRKNDKPLGEETVNKLFPPVHKVPYVCQVTTSQKDSTYSSSFSSDANGSKNNEKLEKKRLVAIQEEHIKVNPSTFVFPQTQVMRNYKETYKHDTVEGRKIFAMVLIEKLNALKKKKVTCFEDSFKDSEVFNKDHFYLHDSSNQFDEDEDIDKYLKEKLENDASKPSSSQDSPLNRSIKGKINTRMSSSVSPEHPSEAHLQTKILPHVSQNVSSPYGHNGFAPPPQSNISLSYHRHSGTLTHGHSKAKHYNLFNVNQTLDRSYKYKDHEIDNVFADDTSGFCSMTTGSNFSSNKGFNNLPKSAIFKKAREMFTENKCDEYEKPSGRKTNREFFSLPRQLKDKEKCIVIGYKSKDSSIPYVCYAPKKTITFRDFRKFLSISSKSKQQFYFKTPCEEESTPYQYVLISDDSTILPIYEGKIMAECRTGSESD